MNSNKKIIAFTITSIILILAAASTGFDSYKKPSTEKLLTTKTDTARNEKKYHFSTWENGRKIHWKAILQNDVVTSLYRNGEQVPANEIAKYRDMINDKIENTDHSLSSFEFEMPDIDIRFDKDLFNQQMDSLREQLKNMKSFRFDYKFDRDQFHKDMRTMKENLKSMHECEFFNREEFQKMMDNLNSNIEKSLENINVNIDMDAIDRNLKNVTIHMKDLKIDMSKLHEKMKQLKGFLKDIKSELVKDGYLNKNDNDYDLDFTRDRIEVNGKRLPDNLLEKYKKIYKEHFGKEIDDTFRIVN
jgi:hypothetical protein